MGAKALMVQGTMSGAGKSLLVAGLCRVLAQDGYRVAPFKSQNMALNSFVTSEGLEMGRAQVTQAEAAGIDPVAAMNPVLLKPTTNTGSQVVVQGKPIGTMSAREFFAFRHKLKEPIMDSFHELERRFDVVLIEGAGSPVELNLKRDDIVNMGMARMANAPVLLVGDIDRGGVFAQLIGTMMLLSESERRYVRASVVNKFRGDATLFEDGVAILEEHMGVPVAGVVPYMPLDIDDEDSMADRLLVRSTSELVDVAILRLPRISNFTDFAALDAIDGVGVRYVSHADELGTPDLIIVPGTKSTLDDLRWLTSCGMGSAVVAAAHAGVPVFGICGGYQMLGLFVEDPHGMEGGGEARGLGLLPVRTTFGTNKHTTQSKGIFCEVGGPLATLSGQPARGYEIHMGTTRREGGMPLLRLREPNGTETLAGCVQNNVYGCYLHGLFDERATAQALVSALLEAKGLSAHAVEAHSMAAYRQHQYDLLANGIRQSLNMDLVYRIIEEGI